MASIHWIAYLIIGFATSIISYIVSYDRLVFFFYAGIFFIFFGLIKMFFAFLKSQLQKPKRMHQHNKGTKTIHKKNQSQMKTHDEHNHHLQRQHLQQNQQQNQQYSHQICPGCKRIVYSTYNFCPYCGFRLR